jgi:hypothetical protein
VDGSIPPIEEISLLEKEFIQLKKHAARWRPVHRTVLPWALALATAVAAHAQPSIDITGVRDVVTTISNVVLGIGAVVILISLIFATFSFVGGNIMRGVTALAGVLIGAGIIGWGPGWVTSLTGQTVTAIIVHSPYLPT